MFGVLEHGWLLAVVLTIIIIVVVIADIDGGLPAISESVQMQFIIAVCLACFNRNRNRNRNPNLKLNLYLYLNLGLCAVTHARMSPYHFYPSILSSFYLIANTYRQL